MDYEKIGQRLAEKQLKITPQRVAVLEALIELGNHPKAENIIEFIKKNHPNIAVGTVYKTLETFVENDLVKMVKTDKDIMRYDAVLDKHHHLYCTESDRIEDYYNKELNEILENYFKKNAIKDFKIQDVKLQIIGNFLNK